MDNMMTAQAKRGRFRFHLSTLVLLSLAAAAVLWANVHSANEDSELDINAIPMCRETKGWPLVAYGSEWHPKNPHQDVLGLWGDRYYWKNLLIDVAIAASILFAVAVLSELMIRRRTRSTPNS